MSTTRSVRPTDLVALVSLDGRVYPNEARTWDSLGHRPEGPRILDSALVPWISFATGRHTWISVQGQSIRALVSARQRGNRTAWEIDCLIAATDDERVVGTLFEQVASEAGGAGVQRIFLRLETGSELMAPARRAGFIPYAEESLLRTDTTVPEEALPEGLSIEPYRTADSFALFRLYNAAVPESIRRVEGPTFQHWQAATERRTAGRAKRNLVARYGGEAIAHLRASHEGGIAKFDLLVHPAAADTVPGLICHVCQQAGTRRPLFCLVPSYAEPLRRNLEDAGFVLDSEYVNLVKRTAQPLSATRPLGARVPSPQAIGAV